MAAEDKKKKVADKSGIRERTEAYKSTYGYSRDSKASVRSYCSGNKWATENAKAVGNW